jgi:hypothetical protein
MAGQGGVYWPLTDQVVAHAATGTYDLHHCAALRTNSMMPETNGHYRRIHACFNSPDIALPG